MKTPGLFGRGVWLGAVGPGVRPPPGELEAAGLQEAAAQAPPPAVAGARQREVHVVPAAVVQHRQRHPD